MTWEVRVGDCRQLMSDMDDCSVDSIVCDPPYGLSDEPDMLEVLQHWLAGDDYTHTGSGFMGKSWDSFVPGPSIWKEALRVLKPGGHLLAFFGSRTYDMGTLAIRIAGFEIRDQIQYLYGSGFPKNHNVSKNLWKTVLSCQLSENARLAVQFSESLHLASNEERAHIAVAPALILPEGAPALIMQIGKAEDSPEPMVMLLSVSEMENISLNTGWSWNLQSVENWQPVNTCITEMKSEMITILETLALSMLSNMPSTTLRNAILPNGWIWPVANVASHSHVELLNTTDIPTLTVLGNATWNPVVKSWPLGSALKPAHEPICVARKPLIGTIATNVLQHGTGALNIDGCRVGDEERVNASAVHNDIYGQFKGEETEGRPVTGRWPANLIHDGSDEVLAGFPDSKSTPFAANTPDVNLYDGGIGHRSAGGFTDSGSAARFFYCAKASKFDRNEGLDEFEAKASAASEFRPNHAEKAAEGEDGNPYGRWQPRKNIHPTVKPTDLMRYLCRLVTPPNGLVLDPFTGSGSTGKGAVLEGFNFLGCELSEEYAEIARARIAHAVKLAAIPDTPTRRKSTPTTSNEMDLF